MKTWTWQFSIFIHDSHINVNEDLGLSQALGHHQTRRQRKIGKTQLSRKGLFLWCEWLDYYLHSLLYSKLLNKYNHFLKKKKKIKFAIIGTKLNFNKFNLKTKWVKVISNIAKVHFVFLFLYRNSKVS